MKKWRLTLLIGALAILVFAVSQVISFKNYEASLPRIHTARSCNDCSYLKVEVSNTQLKQIAGRAFYVKPVDTFCWKNKCLGTQGMTVVYKPSDEKSGIPVSICN